MNDDYIRAAKEMKDKLMAADRREPFTEKWLPLVLNAHKRPDSSNAIYIGRKPSARYHFGNPFSHLSYAKGTILVSSREEACDRFDTWLDGTSDREVEPERREWILKNMEKLRDRDLLCYCAPERCHGESYLRRLYER